MTDETVIIANFVVGLVAPTNRNIPQLMPNGMKKTEKLGNFQAANKFQASPSFFVVYLGLA